MRRISSSFAVAAFAVAGLFAPSKAAAFPLTSKNWTPPLGEYSVELTGSAFNFNGVVALANCSASYVRFKGASDDARGLVLTNGHCTGGLFGGFPKPGEVIHNKPSSFGISLLDQNGRRIASLRADKILYATMTDTDAALLEMNQTYRQIKAQTGVDPLWMADQRANVGVSIEIPSGYWKRTYACQIEAFVHVLKEASWTMRDSIRYSASGCSVVGGTSGSPVVSTTTGEVVGVNNTGNESGLQCEMNNPCEVDDQGNVSVLHGRGYAQQTYWFYSCLNANRELDLNVTGCVLPKPARR